jgi:hypothetical protein
VVTPKRLLVHIPIRSVLMAVERIGDLSADHGSPVLVVAIRHEEFIRGFIGFSSYRPITSAAGSGRG